MFERLVSGGQTGVDRAALDAARTMGIACGGWCPRNRRAEDGPIAPCYPLSETPSYSYAQRTEWNVRDSDATLIIVRGPVTGGTRYTREVATRLHKPVLTVAIDDENDQAGFDGWLRSFDVRVLNVAGPRESQCPGIYAQAKSRLLHLFETELAHMEFKPCLIQR